MSLKTKSALSTPLNNKNSFILKKVISSSLIGYIAGKIFTAINPMSAFIFNLTAEVVHAYTKSVFKKRFLISSKFFRSLISFSAAYYLTNLIGKITLIGAFKVTALTIVSQIALGTLFFITAAMGGFAILTYEIIKFSIKKFQALRA